MTIYDVHTVSVSAWMDHGSNNKDGNHGMRGNRLGRKYSGFSFR